MGEWKAIFQYHFRKKHKEIALACIQDSGTNSIPQGRDAHSKRDKTADTCCVPKEDAFGVLHPEQAAAGG